MILCDRISVTFCILSSYWSTSLRLLKCASMFKPYMPSGGMYFTTKFTSELLLSWILHTQLKNYFLLKFPLFSKPLIIILMCLCITAGNVDLDSYCTTTIISTALVESPTILSSEMNKIIVSTTTSISILVVLLVIAVLVGGIVISLKVKKSLVCKQKMELVSSVAGKKNDIELVQQFENRTVSSIP